MGKILTQTAVEALKPGPARREVPDAKVPGLRIIVQPSGARSWALRYRFLDAPKKLTIGPYPAVSLADARKKAMEAHAEIARGNDPSAQKKAAKDAAKDAERQDDLIENVIAEYVERYAKARTRDWRETQRILNRDVSERWRGRRVDEIRKPDIIRMLELYHRPRCRARRQPHLCARPQVFPLVRRTRIDRREPLRRSAQACAREIARPRAVE